MTLASPSLRFARSMAPVPAMPAAKASVGRYRILESNRFQMSIGRPFRIYTMDEQQVASAENNDLGDQGEYMNKKRRQAMSDDLL